MLKDEATIKDVKTRLISIESQPKKVVVIFVVVVVFVFVFVVVLVVGIVVIVVIVVVVVDPRNQPLKFGDNLVDNSIDIDDIGVLLVLDCVCRVIFVLICGKD